MDKPLATLDASALEILPYRDQWHRTLAIPLPHVSHVVFEKSD